MEKFDGISFYGHEDEELQKEYKRLFCNMTQEEKQLLIKDLCGRLPYGVMTNYENHIYVINEIDPACKDIDYITVRIQDVERLMCAENVMIENIKPYLRPMSSMSEEELDECVEYSGIRGLECPQIETFEDRLLWAIKMFSTDYKSVDWLNTHHFDYRGLILMGLALEAPKDMY